MAEVCVLYNIFGPGKMYDIARSIVIVLLWVGMWGILEIGVDAVAGDNIRRRLGTYILAVLLGILLIWILDAHA